MDKGYLLEKPQGRCNKTYISKNFPEEYTKVLEYPGESFSEKLYNYFYNCPEHKCEVCGKDTPFVKITTGYKTCCCKKCSNVSCTRLNKIKNTIKERYGVENASQSEIIKQKKKETVTKNYGGFGWSSKEISNKSKQTIKERYGVENASQSDIIKQKKKETATKNFGGEGFASKIIKEKTIKTLKNNYGVTNPFQINGVKEKARKKYYEKFLKENPIVKSIDHNTNIYTCNCTHPETCNLCEEKIFKISNIGYNNRKYANCELCTKLSSENTDNYKNTTIEIFIQDILKKYNIKFETNIRNLIYPYELDIYIPEKNIAIECNGIYWHCDINKEK